MAVAATDGLGGGLATLEGLPKALQYAPIMGMEQPERSEYVTFLPVNSAQTYTAGQIIEFSLPRGSGFYDTNSMVLEFDVSFTAVSGVAAAVSFYFEAGNFFDRMMVQSASGGLLWDKRFSADVDQTVSLLTTQDWRDHAGNIQMGTAVEGALLRTLVFAAAAGAATQETFFNLPLFATCLSGMPKLLPVQLAREDLVLRLTLNSSLNAFTRSAARGGALSSWIVKNVRLVVKRAIYAGQIVDDVNRLMASGGEVPIYTTATQTWVFPIAANQINQTVNIPVRAGLRGFIAYFRSNAANDNETSYLHRARFWNRLKFFQLRIGSGVWPTEPVPCGPARLATAFSFLTQVKGVLADTLSSPSMTYAAYGKDAIAGNDPAATAMFGLDLEKLNAIGNWAGNSINLGGSPDQVTLELTFGANPDACSLVFEAYVDATFAVTSAGTFRSYM